MLGLGSSTEACSLGAHAATRVHQHHCRLSSHVAARRKGAAANDATNRIPRATSENTAAEQQSKFHSGLGEAGFVQGKNVAVEYHWADGQYDRLPAMAADLVRRPVSLIVAQGPPAALAARAATATIPIVLCRLRSDRSRASRAPQSAGWQRDGHDPAYRAARTKAD